MIAVGGAGISKLVSTHPLHSRHEITVLPAREV